MVFMINDFSSHEKEREELGEMKEGEKYMYVS